MLLFRTFAVDLTTRRVLRGGELQHLEPQAFDLLAELIRERHRAMSKDELKETIWGGRWISDSALATRVKEIRRATGDDGELQTVVRTVRGHGYQFIAAEIEAASLPLSGPLLGRERDIALLKDRMLSPGLLTLVGPGGVGKSSLARQITAIAGSARFDGALTVDLTAIDTAAQLPAAVARAAGVVGGQPEDLAPALARTDGILLLDDADEFVAEVATLCQQLLEQTGRLTVIVTCRERLGVASEQLWPVLPLSVLSARELLTSRAADLAPLAELSSHSDKDLDDLTAAVDRLPLGIEMLASMSAVLSVPDLLELVHTRPDLVTATRRDTSGRHDSLQLLIYESLRRLDEPSYQGLLALTAFAGAFTASDGADVAADDHAPGLSIVRELVDRSLLSPVGTGGAPRFQVLRTVAAAVASQREHEGDQSARRHAVFVAQTLTRADHLLRGPQEAQGAGIFARLADDARTAHAWALTHDRELALELTAALHLYSYSRMWPEPALWAHGFAEPGLPMPIPVAAVLATAAAQSGELDRARELAGDVLTGGDPWQRTSALETLSDVALYQGRMGDAVELAQQLVEVGRHIGSARAVAIGTTNWTLALVYQDEPLAALEVLSGLEEHLTQTIAPSEEAWLAYARGEALAALGAAAAAEELTRAIRLGDQVGNVFVSGVAQATYASVLGRGPDLGSSVDTFIAIMTIFLRRDNVTHLTTFLRNVVPVLAGLEEFEAAVTVGAYTHSHGARPGTGRDVEGVDDTLARISALLGPAEVSAWMTAGELLSVVGAAEVALAALRSHTEDSDRSTSDPHADLMQPDAASAELPL